MRAKPAKTSFNIHRVTAMLVIGVAAVVCSCVGALLWMLSISSASVDSAAEAGAPVAPLALRGTRSVLRDGQWLPRWGAIHVSIGVPRMPTGADWRSAIRLRDSVRAEILRGCGEPYLVALPTLTVQ